MAAAVLTLLLAASLPQLGASSGAAGASRALLEKLAHRRLSGDENESAPFSEECLQECPKLADMMTAVDEATAALEAKENKESWEGPKMMIDMICDHQDAATCFVGADACNGSEAQGFFEMYTDKLTCICDKCTKAKILWAKLQADDEGDSDATTTEGFMFDTTMMDGTTTKMDGENTDEEMCQMYALGSCVVDYPDACQPLDDLMGLGQLHNGSMGELMEQKCTGDLDPDTIADDDDDEDDDDDDDDAGDVVSSCGPVGLGWFTASVPPVMAALQLMAA